MEQTKLNNVMKKVNKVYSCPENELMKVYDDWAEKYDKDVGTLRCSSPYQAAEKFMKYIRPDAKVIDIACGTGIVGDSLRKRGFSGILHGLDGSQEMLKVAKEKGSYNELFVQYLKLGEPIKSPEDVKYDGLICVGAFTKNHLDPRLVEDFLSVLSPGAMMAIAVLQTSVNETVLKTLMDVFKKLEESDKIVKHEWYVVAGAMSLDVVKAAPEAQQSCQGDCREEPDLRIFCYKKK